MSDQTDATPDSGTTSPGRRSRGLGAHPVLAFVAALLVVVGGTELAVRAAASRLPEPLEHFSGQSQTVVDDMDVLQAHGITSRLTFVGTSMVRRDVDAARVEKELRWPDTAAHNVALPGAQTTVVQRWLLEEVVPRIHPKRVVWGVSTLDFNAGRPDHPIDQYNAARASQHGFFGALDRIMGHLAVSEHREALRDPYQLKSVAQGTPKKYAQHRPLKARATWKLEYDQKTPAQLKRMKANHKKTVQDRQLKDFHIGDDELSAFTSTIDTLHRMGIEVAIVVMPVPTDYLPLHPNGEADYDAWKRTITAEAKRHGAPILDLEHAMPDSAFRDYEHLWPKPAREQFTPLLVRSLCEIDDRSFELGCTAR